MVLTAPLLTLALKGVVLGRKSKSGKNLLKILCRRIAHELMFVLILYVPSTIFQLNRDRSSLVEPVLSYDKRVLFKDHNAVTPVRMR